MNNKCVAGTELPGCLAQLRETELKIDPEENGSRKERAGRWSVKSKRVIARAQTPPRLLTAIKSIFRPEIESI